MLELEKIISHEGILFIIGGTANGRPGAIIKDVYWENQPMELCITEMEWCDGRLARQFACWWM